MDEDEVKETLEALDRLYPNGWRSGDQACDSLTFLMALNIRKLSKVMFPK